MQALREKRGEDVVGGEILFLSSEVHCLVISIVKTDEHYKDIIILMDGEIIYWYVQKRGRYDILG